MLAREDERTFFPVTGHLAYLNHAGVAPLCEPAARAVRDAVEEALTWGAVRYERFVAGVEMSRASAAKLLGVDPSTVAFVKNTSEGISLVAQGFGWKEGDAVVVPDGEFPSNVYPWLNLAPRGVRTIRVPRRNGRLELEDYLRCMDDPAVQMLALSSVEFDNGFANDLETLGALCRERGIFFFVDAIQSLGCMPLDPIALGVDALAADGHKWLLSPEGVGVFYVSPEAMERIDPVVVGWNTVKNSLDFSTIDYTLREDARRFEPGTWSTALILGLGAGCEHLTSVGPEKIRDRVFATVDKFALGLRERGYSILTSLEPGERSGILSFVPRTESAKLAGELAKRSVFVAARGEGLRVSPHYYNDDSDVERFFGALDEADG